jgi:uncharacterized delta-60 repeat protein
VGGEGEFGFAVARYNPDGTLDTSFGSGGKVSPDESFSYANVRALTVQADGKIIAAGEAISVSPRSFGALLARYASDGTLDATFGNNGKVVTPGDFDASGLAIQPDGKIVVAEGTEGWEDCGDVSKFRISRYYADGSLDSAFGVGGRLISNFSGHPQTWVNAGAYAVAIQTDGKIITAGGSFTGTSINTLQPFDFALARHDSGGTPDAAFDNDGKVTTDFLGASIDIAKAVAIQPDGRIIAAGFVHARGAGADSGDLALARYDSDGRLDPTFGAGGKVITAGAFPRVWRATSGIAIQSDGKIVVTAGIATDARVENPQFSIFRYDESGKLDVTFGIGGRIVTDFSGGASAAAVAIQPDGKIPPNPSLR